MISADYHPFVSVIIPTYNRAATLSITLESLVEQTYPKHKYEIVVVDNNSSDTTRRVVEQWQQKSLVPIKYLFEKRQGVHFARNVALGISKGEILYYTDDDMIADNNLLIEIVKPFAYDSRVAAVTGRVLPKWKQQPPDWVVNLCSNWLLSLHDRPERLIIAPYDCGVFSCHQALRRSAFIESGGFNPENTAGEWIGDGETGMNIKLQRLGYWFCYTSASVTHHMIPLERMSQKYLNKRLANQGNCDSYTDYRRHAYSRFDLVRQIISHAVGLLGQFIRCCIKWLANRESWRLNRGRVGYFRSRIFYDIRLITDDNWRRMVTKSDWLRDEVSPAPGSEDTELGVLMGTGGGSLR
jgi:glycosyltransferase involved in cell wall biosynthesis